MIKIKGRILDRSVCIIPSGIMIQFKTVQPAASYRADTKPKPAQLVSRPRPN